MPGKCQLLVLFLVRGDMSQGLSSSYPQISSVVGSHVDKCSGSNPTARLCPAPWRRGRWIAYCSNCRRALRQSESLIYLVAEWEKRDRPLQMLCKLVNEDNKVMEIPEMATPTREWFGEVRSRFMPAVQRCEGFKISHLHSF